MDARLFVTCALLGACGGSPTTGLFGASAAPGGSATGDAGVTVDGGAGGRGAAGMGQTGGAQGLASGGAFAMADAEAPPPLCDPGYEWSPERRLCLCALPQCPVGGSGGATPRGAGGGLVAGAGGAVAAGGAPGGAGGRTGTGGQLECGACPASACDGQPIPTHAHHICGYSITAKGCEIGCGFGCDDGYSGPQCVGNVGAGGSPGTGGTGAGGIGSCGGPYLDCDGLPGCERPSTSVGTCGSCTIKCASGYSCVPGPTMFPYVCKAP
jgi:hypothetical protein